MQSLAAHTNICSHFRRGKVIHLWNLTCGVYAQNQALIPPSMTNVAPVTYAASSESSQAMPFAISSGVPIRLLGLISESLRIANSRSSPSMSVLVGPGATVLIRMP